MLNKEFLTKLLASGGGNLNTASSASTGIGQLLKGKGGAALAGGALGYLLGSKKGRKMGGKVLTYGGLAALGVIAYKAYGNWQQQQQQSPTVAPQTVDRLPEPAAEQHCKAILVAIIAAAKADGHIDERERELIEQEVNRLTAEPALRRFVDAELRKPLDPTAVASLATTPELATEIYLASVLVIDEESFMERSYLTELAKQLRLPEGLQQELRAQIRDAELQLN
jgi:uncharacterized membrane protein YebE (DUF533 family)